MKNGFTIVEIIVVIAIIAVLTGTGLASFSLFSKQSKVRSETRKLSDTLELAKRKAIAGDGMEYCRALNYQYVKGYKVRIANVPPASTNVQYTLIAMCGNDAFNPPNFESNVITSGSLDPKVIISDLPSNIEFKVRTGEATITGPNKLMIRINSVVHCISITDFGVITEKRGSACSDS